MNSDIRHINNTTFSMDTGPACLGVSLSYCEPSLQSGEAPQESGRSSCPAVRVTTPTGLIFCIAGTGHKVAGLAKSSAGREKIVAGKQEIAQGRLKLAEGSTQTARGRDKFERGALKLPMDGLDYRWAVQIAGGMQEMWDLEEINTRIKPLRFLKTLTVSEGRKRTVLARPTPFNSLKGAGAKCENSPSGVGGSVGEIRENNDFKPSRFGKHLKVMQNKLDHEPLGVSQTLKVSEKHKRINPSSLLVRENRTVANNLKQSSAYET